MYDVNIIELCGGCGFANDSCGVRSVATDKERQVILDFNMYSEIITFEKKGRFGREKHQNLGVKVKVVANMVSGNT